MIVVDASVIAPALADDDDDGDQARARLTDERLAAPDLLILEVAQVLRRAMRSRRLDARRGAQAIDDLAALPIAYAPHRPLLERVWQLRENSTAYDAAYLALAELLGVTLLTADRRLAGVPGIRCPVQVLATSGPASLSPRSPSP